MATTVDVVIPVLNEERALPGSVAKLRAFLDAQSGRDWRIVVADNGSTDATPEVARDLARSIPCVSVTRLEERGRGRALKKAWLESDAEVCCYMDVDLSTRLDALPPLVSAVAEEGYDVAIGSRLLPGSEVVGRTLKREITSRGYSLLFRSMFRTVFRDAQCGFKAVRTEAARAVLPLVKDTGWFFDTEFLIVAQRSGYRIREIPVHWEDDPDTRVKIVSTAWRDVKGLLRLRLGGVPVAPRRGGVERP
ncbi:MAG: glycosyltransferase family 2 protein [Gemmatimonadetes bacterium]|nr:glycosyltransferase family 2 protein [Gemmatimonadota bacterium]